VESLLRGDAEIVREYWGVRRGGNFEGRTILHVAVAPSVVARRHGLSLHELDRVVERARTTLYAERSRRPWPALDDKVIAAWNGLMLRAVADGARILGDAELRALALRNGAFLREHMVRDGRVARSWRSGEAKPFGFPRGPRGGSAGLFGPLRTHLRRVLVGRRDGDRRRGDRALLRPGERPLLRHGQRP
jgi:uncharacterized protein YyaL (SSP411 family)